jgi:acyl-CoA synthetase (AMP-forming)/AMP-acid ligase II
VGYPPPHVRIGIFHPDEAAGAVARARPYAPRLPEQLLLPNGTTGIIGTRGPHVMSGYWSRGAIVRVGDDGGGWVLTNDLGYIHTVSGKLYFRGRADDVIRTGGESVLAADVERVILDLTSPTDDDSDNANDKEKHTIVECSVFPLPDEKFGEAVCAAVVLSSKGKAAPALVEGGTASASWDTASTNTLVGDGNNDSTPSAERTSNCWRESGGFASNVNSHHLNIREGCLLCRPCPLIQGERFLSMT